MVIVSVTDIMNNVRSQRNKHKQFACEGFVLPFYFSRDISILCHYFMRKCVGLMGLQCYDCLRVWCTCYIFFSSSKLEKVVFDKPSLYICMYCKWLVLYYLFMSFCFGLMLFPSIRLPDYTRVPCDFLHQLVTSAFLRLFSLSMVQFLSLNDFPGLSHYIHG